jgi:hypothetical protein
MQTEHHIKVETIVKKTHTLTISGPDVAPLVQAIMLGTYDAIKVNVGEKGDIVITWRNIGGD